MPKKKVSEAQMRATKKWQEKAYDRAHILFPAGTKDRIQFLGKTINGYTVKAVLAQLEKDEKEWRG